MDYKMFNMGQPENSKACNIATVMKKKNSITFGIIIFTQYCDSVF